jgi:hypothetical protein
MDQELLDADHAGFGLNIHQAGLDHLNETRKWARFISIVGFVFLALFVLTGLFAGTLFSSFYDQFGGMAPGFLFSGIYLLMALLGFFPNFYMFKYAEFIGFALRSKDPALLTTAFSFEKKLFRYSGLLLAMVLGFYALIILIAMIAAMAF